ncbi:MAG TPA: hypothetical protein VGX71_11585 [Pseudaminobacter sp.]|nr:hypothetical protein [Pseudaminobacter sp.]
MKSALFAAALVAATSTAALAQSVTDDVRALPFVKANAYAKAIDRFCFADRTYASARLFQMAAGQATALWGDAADEFAEAERAAIDHLKHDQSACAPAMAFVDKATASIEEMRPALAAMRKAIDADRAERQRADDEVAAKEKVAAQKIAADKRLAETIALCADGVATAQLLLNEGGSMAWTVFPETLPQCIEDVPETPKTAKLLAKTKTVLAELTARIEAEKSAAK